jgi:hypothetical protein
MRAAATTSQSHPQLTLTGRALLTERVCAVLTFAASLPGEGRRKGYRQPGERAETITGASVGDGLPDQLGHVDNQIRSCQARIARRPDLADAHADRIVQPPIGGRSAEWNTDPTTWRSGG